MLRELGETEATGALARIYGEIRRLWAVPYVSAIHRHMATEPGLLEWAWAAVGSAFHDGRGQEAGWQAARDLPISPLPPISRDALRLWGVAAEDERSISDICAGFERVAPVNMIFAGLVRARLTASDPGAGSAPAGQRTWTPPPALPAPPPLVDLTTAPPALRGALEALATRTDGKPFVPGLYRMLGHWPQLAAHLSTVLAPRLTADETIAAADQLRARIDHAVDSLLPTLPPDPMPSARPTGPAEEQFLSVLATYRKTSPEMVLFGGLIRRALPG